MARASDYGNRGYGKSEDLLRDYLTIHKIPIMESQALVCASCGYVGPDKDKKCNLCGSTNFRRPDFRLNERIFAEVDGSVHDVLKVEKRDIELDKELFEVGILCMRIREDALKRHLNSYRMKIE